MSDITDIFTVSFEEAGSRLDKLLTSRFPEHSRTYFQYLIEQGCVLVNGSIIKKREKPKVDDEIEVCFQLTPEISLAAEEIPLEILYEDEHILAINKPPGMVVHPAPGHPSGTFVNALLHHCRGLTGDPLRPGIVHRLDKDTSGVLLAAKTQEAHQKLVHAFATRNMEKTYLAIAVGKAHEGLIDAPIKRHPIYRKEMAICLDTGKEAKSDCRLLAYNNALSLVEIKLISGRTHQIRVHLKYRGTPVLGDRVYGSMSANKKHNVERQLLHAHRIAFLHPVTKTSMQIVAPLPKDLLTFSEVLNYQWEETIV